MKFFVNVFLSLLLFISSNKNDFELREITNQELSEIYAKYSIEKNKKEKEFLAFIVKPEAYDLNKDNRISKNELNKVIRKIVYVDKYTKEKLDANIQSNLNSNIDAFIEYLPSFLTYKEYQYVISKININMFIDIEHAKVILQGKDQKREHEEDL